MEFRYLLAMLVFSLSSSVFSQLTIDVVGGGQDRIPITIVPFKSEGGEASASKIIAADLERSGLFKLQELPVLSSIPQNFKQVDFGFWRDGGSENLVIGSMESLENGKIRIRFRLIDIVKGTQVLGASFEFKPKGLRRAAHRIADLIYEKLTGDTGVFSTKICYVVKKGKIFEIHVADADGHDPVVVHRYNEPVISPRWSPDGRKLVYVSFEEKKAIVYVLDIYKGKRTILARFEGSNSAPAWAPDGKSLAITLTKDGVSQIYVIKANGRGLRQITRSQSIDTEPNFSPDGKYILFTSDRAGGPQIYRMRSDGRGKAKRITFEGKYNVSPRYSPDGKSFVFIHRNNRRFNVAIQDFSSGVVQILTAGAMDHSPTFAPNGKIILYASEIGEKRRGILSAVSRDGRIKQRYSLRNGDVREPAWGPILTK